MNILDNIIAQKKTEVAEKKKLVPVSELETFPFYTSACNSLVSQLTNEGGTGVVAEFKRKSPSKGIINADATIASVVAAYDQYASGISILTDEVYFGGSIDDLIYAREMVNVPILRKDFIIDEYQVTEAKAIGGSVILLIAACLTPKRVQELALFAKRLSLEVLLEVHNEDELNHICNEVDMVGVNNRDLRSFDVDINRSIELADKIPADKIKISESGISDPSTIARLKHYGYRGFLIGETFMKQPNPAIAFADFIHQLRQIQEDGLMGDF